MQWSHNVGYWLQLPKEGILSLNPDIVIASNHSKPKKFITSLDKFGIKAYMIEDENTIASAKKKIMDIAIILNEKDKAKKIIKRIDTNVSKLQNEIKKIKNKKKVLFILSIRSGSMMIAGKKTKAGAMIKLSGGINASNVNNFTMISKESLLKINPDVIIFAKHGNKKFFKDKFIQSTKASKNSQIYSMDMLLISGFTVRLDKALMQLSCMINKDLSYCKTNEIKK